MFREIPQFQIKTISNTYTIRITAKKEKNIILSFGFIWQIFILEGTLDERLRIRSFTSTIFPVRKIFLNIFSTSTQMIQVDKIKLIIFDKLQEKNDKLYFSFWIGIGFKWFPTIIRKQ